MGEAFGVRYPPKGAEFLLLIIRHPFQYAFAYIAPLGCRKGAELVKVQGILKMRRGQGRDNGVVQ